MTVDPEYTHVLLCTGGLLTAEQAEQYAPEDVALLSRPVAW